MAAADRTLFPVRDAAREQLLAKLDADTVRCGVIGLGFIGSVLMDALITAGLEAHGYDRSDAAADRYRRHAATHRSMSQRTFSCASSAEVLQGCDVIFVAVRNPVEDGVIDEEPLFAAAALLQSLPARPRLIVLESTVMPGATRTLAAQIQGDETFVAHAPERLSAGHDHQVLKATPHLVAGMDDAALELVVLLIGKLCDVVVPVSAPEVSELSKLLENAYLSVNIGLANEITRLSQSLGIRAAEVCNAAATKPFGFAAFHPGAGIGGHCLPNDLHMLAAAARARGWRPELLEGAIAVNERAPCVAVDRLELLLQRRRVALAGAAVLLVGVGFKPGSGDVTRSPAFDVVRQLRTRGAVPHYADALVPCFAVDDALVPRVAVADVAASRFAAALILSGDPSLSVEQLLSSVGVVLDAGGSRRGASSPPGLETL